MLAVGLTQPFAVLRSGGQLIGDRSLGGFVNQADTFRNGTPASITAGLLILAVLVIAGQAMAAVSNRTERARRVTVALAVLVFVLGLVALVAVGAAEPIGALPDESLSGEPQASPKLTLTAQGPVPLLAGAVAVWIAASRAKRPDRLLERTISI